MITGLIITASALTIFTFGAFLGYRLNERKTAAQTMRQVAAQSSLYKQLQELQDARQRDYSSQPDHTLLQNSTRR